MLNVLLVGIGGFIGSVSRYLVGGWVHNATNIAWFPVGTFTVNMCGCFLIGFLGGVSESLQVFTPETRLLVFIGVLGGFTTFSSFGYETFTLIRDGEVLAAAANAGLQVMLGLGFVWLGDITSRIL
jgi:CrcB protein